MQVRSQSAHANQVKAGTIDCPPDQAAVVDVSVPVGLVEAVVPNWHTGLVDDCLFIRRVVDGNGQGYVQQPL